MKKSIKAIISAALAASILTSVGCSHNGDSKDSKDSKTTPAVQDNAAAPDGNTDVTPQKGDATLLGIKLYRKDNPWLMYDVDIPLSKSGLDFVIGHPNLTGQSVIADIQYSGTKLLWNGVEYKKGEPILLEETNTVTIEANNKVQNTYTVMLPNRDNGIPTVIIDTELDDGTYAEIKDKLNYVDAKITLIGSNNDFYNADAGIKLRGNSTMGYGKKPYRIKFDEKQNVLGLGKAKSWVLLANYLDPASMRGELAFGLASRINESTAESVGRDAVFAPRMKPVEVYLNGVYLGLYDMGDHMQVDDIRVDIDESGDDGSTETDIGYFVEVEVMDRVLREGEEGYEDWSDYSYIQNVGAYGTGQNNCLYFQFKLPEEPTDDQKAFITDYLQTVNDLIISGDEAVFEYIDVDSFVDWYIVNELFKNTDSHMQSSIYFHKDKGGKLFMGPVWDFDLSTGSQTALDLDDPEGYWTRLNDYCGWFKALFEMEAFETAVNERWSEIRYKGIVDAIFNDMDTFIENAGAAAEADYNKWHGNYTDTVGADNSPIPVPDIAIDGSWSDQVDYLRDFLTKRISWLDGEFGYIPPETYLERGLPAVLIDTDGQEIPDKLNYVDAKITLIGSDSNIYFADAGIKLRGNSTMMLDKKPYRIKFDEKQNVLGLGKAKSWVLLANYLDPASMRGELAFGLASRINASTAEESERDAVFAPRMKPVEVYLNGEYIGLYDMGDHMQVDDIRVDIDESGDDGSTETDIGYFIEIEVMERVLREGEDGYEDWSAYSFISNVGAFGQGQENQLYFQFKLPETPTEAQKTYITEYMQSVNDRIIAGDESVTELIDIDSFVDWYIVNELFKNTDSQMQSSIYFYKDKGGKLFMGPVWDFDLSSGSQIVSELGDPEGYRTRRSEYCGWFEALFKMDCFKSKLTARWAELRENGIIDAVFTDMDAFVENVGTAANYDYEKWFESFTKYCDKVDYHFPPDIALTGTWADQVDYLRDFLTKRIAWFDGEMGYTHAAIEETEAPVQTEAETVTE